MVLRNFITIARALGRTNVVTSSFQCHANPLRSTAVASQCRNYAIYKPEDFQEPVTDPAFLEETVQDEEQLERLKYIRVHPARPFRTNVIFDHPRVFQFSNYLMKKGNRALARKLLEETFERVKRKQLHLYHSTTDPEERDAIETYPLNILLNAIENVRPYMDVMDISKGGIMYQVPVPLSDEHSYFTGMRWLVLSGRNRPHRRVHFPENLANELIDAHNMKGRVVQQKIALHKLCEENKAYAHFRWA